MSYINLKYKSYGSSEKFEVNMEKVMKSLKKSFKFKLELNKDIAYRSCLCPRNNVCTHSAIEQVDSKIMNISGLRLIDTIDFQEKPDVLKNTFNPKSCEKICRECVWDKKRLCRNNLG